MSQQQQNGADALSVNYGHLSCMIITWWCKIIFCSVLEMDRFLFQTSPALLVPLENPEQRNFLLLSSHICTLFPIFPHNEKGSYNRAMIFHVLACFGHFVLGNPVSELQVARNDREWHVGGSGHTFGNSNLAVVFLNSTNSDEVLQGVFVFCCVMWARVYLMRCNYFKVFWNLRWLLRTGHIRLWKDKYGEGWIEPEEPIQNDCMHPSGC